MIIITETSMNHIDRKINNTGRWVYCIARRGTQIQNKIRISNVFVEKIQKK